MSNEARVAAGIAFLGLFGYGFYLLVTSGTPPRRRSSRLGAAGKAPISVRCVDTFSADERTRFELEPPIGFDCTWKCTGPVQAATFRRVDQPEEYAILHPSTKRSGSWQMSWFDKDGPYGDSLRDTCNVAVNELSKRGVPRLGPKGKPQPQWKLEEWA